MSHVSTGSLPNKQLFTPVERPMKQCPVFRMMSLRFFARAKLTPATTSAALVARIAYCDKNPMVQVFGQPAGGPGWPVAVFGSQVLLLQTGMIGMVGWSALNATSQQGLLIDGCWTQYSRPGGIRPL